MMKKLALTPLERIHARDPPTWRAKDVGETTIYGTGAAPLRFGRGISDAQRAVPAMRAHERARFLPRFGPLVKRNTLLLLFVD